MDVIGLDLDGVLCNTEHNLRNLLIDKFNYYMAEDDLVCYDLEKAPGFTKEIVNFLLDSINETGKFFEAAPPTDYAEHAVNKLRNEGCRIYIITTRKEKFRQMTVHWLRDNNIHCDHLFNVPAKEKAVVIKENSIKAFVEDRFSTLTYVLSECGPLELGLYCVNRKFNERYYNENIVRVSNIAEAVDRIVEYRKWRGFFIHKCQGNIEKFIKEYQDGKGKV
jgi:uncharacterized HAD superfamily protein